MNDIAINKIQSIQRCVRRAREEYQADRDGFATNYTRQDAALLNVLWACETAIDLANHVIRGALSASPPIKPSPKSSTLPKLQAPGHHHGSQGTFYHPLPISCTSSSFFAHN
jgi:hypothetical protein